MRLWLTIAATDRLVYADSSALVKLAVHEPESIALRSFLDERRPGLVSSALALVEVMRAARLAAPDGSGARRARAQLDETRLVHVDRELLEAAVSWTSVRVRALDAIHLASALRVQASEMLVYDRRLAEAAAAAGLEVLSPGA